MKGTVMKKKVIILGAAGRDFHNFNVRFRDNEKYEVVAFTATQIPNIEGRVYPTELAGKLYPKGIPIFAEDELEHLIEKFAVDTAVFSYSDVTHNHVMHLGSRVVASRADFLLLSAQSTMLKSTKPVIAVTAIRTGSGKSQTTRKVCEILRNMGKRVVAVRHPMPYGDLKSQIVQRFGDYKDFDIHDITIEEREEYEPLVEMGIVVYAGVDYEKILRAAETEADIVIWDGGNNDTSFYAPDLSIVVFDPHRAGHELLYHPGEVNLRLADVALINKVDTASRENIDIVRANIERINPHATVIMANSPVTVADPEAVKGKRVLVVEDGPTLTHGEMKFGAGIIAAKAFGAGSLIDPKSAAVGSIKAAFAKYPHIEGLLPAIGYGEAQMKDLADTINSVDCDIVLSATPIDLSKIITITKPIVRVRYAYGDAGSPTLGDIIGKRFGK
jgi:predicted GTPase